MVLIECHPGTRRADTCYKRVLASYKSNKQYNIHIAPRIDYQSNVLVIVRQSSDLDGVCDVKQWFLKVMAPQSPLTRDSEGISSFPSKQGICEIAQIAIGSDTKPL